MSEAPLTFFERLFTLRSMIAICILAVVVAAIVGGQKGAIGMSLGIVGTSFHLWALWRLCVLSGAVAPAGPKAQLGAILSILAFFMKIPVLMVISNAMQKLGGQAHSCFLSGLGVVYCLMIGWALARR